MARQLIREIYSVTKHGAFRNDYDLQRQIRRASVSIMSNIAEGFERDGTKKFLQFLSQAKGSASEVRAQLYVASDQRYIDQVKFDELCLLAKRIGRMIVGLDALPSPFECTWAEVPATIAHDSFSTRNEKPETRF